MEDGAPEDPALADNARLRRDRARLLLTQLDEFGQPAFSIQQIALELQLEGLLPPGRAALRRERIRLREQREHLRNSGALPRSPLEWSEGTDDDGDSG